ncbi:MAG: hypothetical protein SF066_14485, partial [Thermoanaerobaculia bacterium]|nr:hypothetical protein [Thermoanaerobaculia bacterium]
QRIEDELFRHIDVHQGDRVSFASFGGADDPLDIQPASRAPEAFLRAREASRKSRFTKTDFAGLFTELRRALVNDRAVDPVDGQRQGIDHQDFVVILSDGVHDPAHWNHHCPDEFIARGRDFVPQEVRKAFRGLGEIAGAKVRVYLVIAGEDLRCTPTIRSEWLLALGADGLQVLTFSEAETDGELGMRVFQSAGRTRGTVIQPFTPELTADQRENLDKNREFWVQYRFQPLLGPSRVEIVEARLDEVPLKAPETGGQDRSTTLRSIPLFVQAWPFGNYVNGPVSSSPLPVDLGEPAGHLRGKPVDQVVYFKKKNNFEPGYSPEKTYSLRLVVRSERSAVPQNAVLLPPTHKTLVSAGLRRRVLWFTSGCAVLALCGWITQSLFRQWFPSKPWGEVLRPSLWSILAIVCLAIFVSQHLLGLLYLAAPFLSAIPGKWLRRWAPRFSVDAYRDWLEFFLPNALAVWLL